MANTIAFPGGSKSRVSRAGKNVRNKADTSEDLKVIEEWRAAHRGVLNTFQAILRTRTKDTNVTVAQRHKRKNTIFDKLKRLPNMQLARMDDVAGCRLIFRDIKELNVFRDNFHKAKKFNHKRRNSPDKYNYIKTPKPTGYRGIHDIYEYDVKSESGKNLAGLYIEIQYRTLVQHAWATAVEVVGFITESQPKFQQGDKRYEHEMAIASEILARAHEGLKGPFPEKSNREILEEFLAIDKELSLLKTLRGLNEVKSEISDKKIPFSFSLIRAHLKSGVSGMLQMLCVHCLFWKSRCRITTSYSSVLIPVRKCARRFVTIFQMPVNLYGL